MRTFVWGVILYRSLNNASVNLYMGGGSVFVRGVIVRVGEVCIGCGESSVGVDDGRYAHTRGWGTGGVARVALVKAP